jgi:hypothetical protein
MLIQRVRHQCSRYGPPTMLLEKPLPQTFAA